MELKKSKALANLVMGLGSQTFASSVTEISLSRCYHYQFSSISKVLDSLFDKAEREAGEEGNARLASEKNFDS